VLSEKEARDAQIQKLREEEAATTRLAIAQENQKRFTQFSGIGAPVKSARDSASVFEQHAPATGGKNAIGAFGLRPYELTNLGYQINDVVTQLASGTSLAQTMAQQGGQILQLFPRVSSAIVGAFGNPLILGFVATLGVIAVAIKDIADRAERLREFQAILTASGDGATYQAAALEKSVEALRKHGIATADSTAALKEFVSKGNRARAARAVHPRGA
jgi:hypothetical protein